ncbi:uncharacterized protein LOC144626808 isoform X2 [Crassostrea virginica]
MFKDICRINSKFRMNNRMNFLYFISNNENMKPNLRYLCFYLTFIGSVVCPEPLCKRPPATPCCYNEYLDPDSKRCNACEPGRIGWSCREDCVRGYYGLLCRQTCKCSSDHCDPVVGCLTTAMTTTTHRITTDVDLTRPQEVTGRTPGHTTNVKDESYLLTQTLTKDPRSTNPYRSARASLISNQVSTTSRQDTIRTDGIHSHTENERRSTNVKRNNSDNGGDNLTPSVTFALESGTRRPAIDLTVPDLLGDSLSLLMTLMVVALFLLVVALAFIIGLLSFITLKQHKGAHIPSGMKLVSMADSSPLSQPWGNLENGYMVLGRRQRPLTNDRQSGYTNPLSREMQGMMDNKDYASKDPDVYHHLSETYLQHQMARRIKKKPKTCGNVQDRNQWPRRLCGGRGTG